MILCSRQPLLYLHTFPRFIARLASKLQTTPSFISPLVYITYTLLNNYCLKRDKGGWLPGITTKLKEAGSQFTKVVIPV